MALLEWDLTGLPKQQREEIDRCFKYETAEALMRAKGRQQVIARHFRDNPPKAVEGFGGETAAIDPVLLAALRRICKPRPGEEGHMIEWAKKKWPHWFKVKHQPTRLQVGFGSTPEVNVPIQMGPQVKFRKVYATQN